MKFIAGNTVFTDNIKQLMPDISIFNRIINNDPTVLENRLWKKSMSISPDGLSSGSITNVSDNVFYRSCYLIYKSGAEIQESNINLSIKNVNSNVAIPIAEFNNWGLVKLEDGLYMLFIWIDIDQSYIFNLVSGTTKLFNSNDWFIQVVI